MMMVLGDFVFELRGAAYQDFQRQTNWRHASQSRIGERAVSQFLGAGTDTITLAGTLMPELTGGRATLDQLRDMGDRGEAWSLIEGNGRIYGLWIVKSMSETATVFFADGVPRKIEFSLLLERVGDERADLVGGVYRAGNQQFA